MRSYKRIEVADLKNWMRAVAALPAELYPLYSTGVYVPGLSMELCDDGTVLECRSEVVDGKVQRTRRILDPKNNFKVKEIL